MALSVQDKHFMRRALTLARRGIGKTSPNPCVGAVLVRNGKIIGEGWHRRAGGPHAEIGALRNAGLWSAPTRRRFAVVQREPGKTAKRQQAGALQNMTLYVTLEPCSTWGRTPPCTDAIIPAGIKRVVVAALDPNPKHNGRGLRVLKRAGIRVEAGLLADEANALNAAFNKWITTGQPLVIAKAAISLDGKMATRTGDSKWITDEAARRKAHQMRARADAVMVGVNTVIRDNPQLTLRHGVRGRQPWRVVVDSRGRSPRNAHLFHDANRHRTIVFTTPLSPLVWRRYLAVLGIVVVVVPAKRGRVDLRVALRELGRMEVTSVLAEGGAELHRALFAERLVDRVAFFVAPIIIGKAARISQAARVSGKTVFVEAKVQG